MHKKESYEMLFFRVKAHKKVSRQDEPNPALRLATRAHNMELSCPLGPTCRVLHEKYHGKPYNKSFIAQACSAKGTGYWPRCCFFFLAVSGPRLAPTRSIHTMCKASVQVWKLIGTDISITC